jgi:hypothetical protein
VLDKNQLASLLRAERMQLHEYFPAQAERRQLQDSQQRGLGWAEKEQKQATGGLLFQRALED